MQDADHHRVGQLGIVEKQCLPRAAQEDGETLAGVDRTDDEGLGTGGVGQAQRVGLEELDGLAHQLALLGHKPEAAALVHVEGRVVEAQNIELRPVHDHDLVVIAAQVVVRPPHTGPRLEEVQFELAQALFSPPVGMGDQSAHGDTPIDRAAQGLCDIGPIETEDPDVDGGLRLVDGGEDGRDPIFRQDDQAHFGAFFSSHTTATDSAPLSAPMAAEI